MLLEPPDELSFLRQLQMTSRLCRRSQDVARLEVRRVLLHVMHHQRLFEHQARVSLVRRIVHWQNLQPAPAIH